MQAHAGGGRELKITDAQVGHLLHAGAGVIEEEQQRAIPERVHPLYWERGQQGLNLIALEKEVEKLQREFNKLKVDSG